MLERARSFLRGEEEPPQTFWGSLEAEMRETCPTLSYTQRILFQMFILNEPIPRLRSIRLFDLFLYGNNYFLFVVVMFVETGQICEALHHWEYYFHFLYWISLGSM